MTTFTIGEVTIPADLTHHGAADFIAAVEVGNIVEMLGYGTTDMNYNADEKLPHYLNPHEPIRMFVARAGGHIVARGIYETQTGDGADTAWLSVQVLPEFRRSGIGTALAEAVEALAASDGKRKALVYTPIAGRGGERLTPPTGFGSVEAHHPDTRFLLARGYRLEQVERASRLGLPVDDLSQRLAAGEQASGPDYRTIFWEGRTPEPWREDLAHLATRMSTDAPSAGLEEPEDPWTVERIIEAERAVDQYATLVLREHRGHRLGMLLKVANLAHLERVAPGHPSVITFNAEENRHMLDVNEAVGFVPIASESAWRKDLH